ncbi:DoxX family protein [Mycobacterium sp. 050134]|uniref:DoxX family protein n=1 Tax=Mycobacterium sp. 050134 TaxID=3096111 RepID=UPI002ED7CF2D
MTKPLNRRLDRHEPAVLCMFRVVYGLLFAAHGSITIFGWPYRWQQAVPFGAWPVWYAGLIELVTGLLVAAGLWTRAAAFVASGEMAVAYFWMHQPRALWPIGDPPVGNGGLASILFCFGFFLLVFTGAGSFRIGRR